MSGANSNQVVVQGSPEAQAQPEEIRLQSLTQITVSVTFSLI